MTPDPTEAPQNQRPAPGQMSPEAMSAELERRFTYHAPTPDQIPKYEEIRDYAHGLARKLVEVCPSSRELSTALTKLDEVVFHANASIARRTGA